MLIARAYTIRRWRQRVVSLLVRLEHIIEHNVSFPSIVETKRLFAKRIAAIAKASAPVLGLTQAQATEVVKAWASC